MLLSSAPALAVRGPLRPEGESKPARADPKDLSRAKVTLVSPLDLGTIEVGDVPIELKTSSYALGPQAGHAHLLVDNEVSLQVPAAGKYLLKGLAPGAHLVRVVLCRPWHEVVKAPGAMALARFWVGLVAKDEKERRAAETAAWPDPRKPMLTYVLPLPDRKLGWPVLTTEDGEVLASGGAVKSTDGAMKAKSTSLDFFLSNEHLSKKGARVRVVLDKKELPTVREWKPVPLKLKGSAHRITIDLLDKRGTKVKNAVNRSDHSFTTP